MPPELLHRRDFLHGALLLVLAGGAGSVSGCASEADAGLPPGAAARALDRKNFERAPLSQVFDVIRDIREGKFKDGRGRPVEGVSTDAPA